MENNICKIYSVPFFKDSYGKNYYGYLVHRKVGNQLLSGTVEVYDESPRDTAIRELKEEFGISEFLDIEKGDEINIDQSILKDYTGKFSSVVKSGYYVDIVEEGSDSFYVRYTERNCKKKNNIEYTIDMWVDKKNVIRNPARAIYYIEVEKLDNLHYEYTSDGHTYDVIFTLYTDFPFKDFISGQFNEN